MSARRRSVQRGGRVAAVLLFDLSLVSAVAGSTEVGHATASEPLELRVPGDARVRIIGPTLKAGFPFAALVQSAGDVNGDRKPDFLFANRQGHGGDLEQSFLLFGGSWPATIRLPPASGRGFKIAKNVAQAAGDVNGDSRDDVMKCSGSPTLLLGRSGRQAAAGSYVVFAPCGRTVQAGDLDRDGRDDLIFLTGRSGLIIYGGRPPRGGFRITAKGNSLQDVGPAGDLNGDGRSDLLVSTSVGSAPAVTARLHVVFGGRRSGTLDLATAAARLPAIVGLGRFVNGFGPAGDVNGDGVGDLVISRTVTARGPNSVCVIFGRRGAWPRTTACGGPRGFVITGTRAPSGLGGIAAAGDIDGDGLGDVLASATDESEPGSTFGGGAVYLVYGRRTTTAVDVAKDDRVIRIAAAPELKERIGFSFAAPGDVTGDGRPDVVLGGDLSGDAWVFSIPRP